MTWRELEEFAEQREMSLTTEPLGSDMSSAGRVVWRACLYDDREGYQLLDVCGSRDEPDGFATEDDAKRSLCRAVARILESKRIEPMENR